MSTIRNEIHIRKPVSNDGLKIHRLIANSPPLDLNSIYSYYLLSDHFRDSCVIAECQNSVIGFISAYRILQQPNTLFVWQVVVDEGFRGQQVAWRMLITLLQRYQPNELQKLEATVNPGNTASRGLFERLAREKGTVLEEEIFLEASAFGSGGNHESEILLRVPLQQQNLKI